MRSIRLLLLMSCLSVPMDVACTGDRGANDAGLPPGDDGGPNDFALRRDGALVQITGAYTECTVDADCTLVGTACNGCCDLGAVERALQVTYEQNFTLACEDYRGPICDCEPPDLVAECRDARCAAVPDTQQDRCAPQDARVTGSITVCLPGHSKIYWNGVWCVQRQGCTCRGASCDVGFATMDACVTAHEGCEDLVSYCGCNADEYCMLPPESMCGALDAGGVCRPRPTACDAVYEPVCGCGGMTFGNWCEAALDGVSLASFEACR